MKFIASKKLSDNPILRGVIAWMVLLLMIAMVLSLSAKGIEFGTTPENWISTVMGNPEEFSEPMLWSDLLLGIHTDLFGLIITFILIASLYVRTSRSTVLKMMLFSALLLTLILYPLGLLASSLLGGLAVTIGLSSFALFHLLILLMSADLWILLVRKKI